MQILNLTILLNFLALVCISNATVSEMRPDFKSLFVWKETPTPAFRSGGPPITIDEGLRQQWDRTLPKTAFYWGMHPANMHIVSTMKDLILAQPTATAALEVAAQMRDLPEVNSLAWLNAVTAASMSRPDWMGFNVPSIVEILPGNFIPGEIISQMKADLEAGVNNYDDPDTCHVTVDGTIGEDNGVENTLWYWREDVMVNANHWYWHIVNAFDAPKGTIDRKGELFYYFHHDAQVRYLTERITNGMEPTKPYDGSTGSPIPIAYNGHLSEANTAKPWTPREADRVSTDISNGKLVGAPMIVDLEHRWTCIQNIIEAIETGEAIPKDTPDMPINLQNSKGIDTLAGFLEASSDSINFELYHDFGVHNTGHIIITFAEDPDESKDLPPGVMAESSVSMRDPMFYWHHGWVDDLLTLHKNKLDPYTLNDGEWPLLTNGVTVDSLKVQILEGEYPENELRTFFETRRYDLSQGMDFNRTGESGPLYICQNNLNHKEFTYSLEITRAEDAEGFEGLANVRIFLGPKLDKDRNPHTFEQLRYLMIFLDIFSVNLEPGGNTITRSSKDTPLTIDFPERFDENGDAHSDPFCGCGWPHHMLLPKSTTEGFPFELFAIATNAADDFVEEIPEPRLACKEAYITCGLMGAKYPDARPMGWPFDRRLDFGGEGDQTIEGFAAAVPNAAHATITIVHEESA